MDFSRQKRLLFVFATTLEAAPFLHLPNVFITGMGSIAVEKTLGALRPECDEIWNIGYAGKVSKAVTFGEIYSISHVGKHASTEKMDLRCQGHKLITFDAPLHDPELRDQLSNDWDLVDMEGFHVARLAEKYGLPCRLIKIVSDQANQETSKTIRENAPFLSNRLYEYVNALTVK